MDHHIEKREQRFITSSLAGKPPHTEFLFEMVLVELGDHVVDQVVEVGRLALGPGTRSRKCLTTITSMSSIRHVPIDNFEVLYQRHVELDAYLFWPLWILSLERCLPRFSALRSQLRRLIVAFSLLEHTLPTHLDLVKTRCDDDCCSSREAPPRFSIPWL